MTARLLPQQPLRGRNAHLAHFGPLPDVDPEALIADVERAGLRGRGGAWFPTARKLRAVRDAARSRQPLSSGRRPVVIANAMEGEPASSKDAVLLSHAPHLVLDGLQAAAAAVGARNAYLAVHRGSSLVPLLDAALAERDDRVRVELITPPARYVASEASALAHWTGEGIATPVFGERPSDRGTRGRPTLVQNVETLAHLALIARRGGDWFAAVGDPSAPGTTLVTVGGAVARPGVIEVETGMTIGEILLLAGGLTAPVTGVLTGGYGGAWVRLDDVVNAPLTPDAMAAAGGAIGAGLLLALPDDACPLAEIARVARWMAGESAGQCGPCRFGLPAIADDLDALLADDAGIDVERHLALVAGRGGCALPDGVVRFVASGLRVFADDVTRHRAGGCLRGTAPGRAWLPVPRSRRTPVSRPGGALR